jgi:hypothetical protein
MYIMRFLELWMEKYGQDYRDYPDMRKEIKVLLKPMRRVGGPYSPCSAKLQQLCHEVKKRRSGAIDPEATYGRFSEPLHDELYTRCRKDVTSGDLPISPEQAVIFAGIQCYIDVCQPMNRSILNLIDPRVYSGYLLVAVSRQTQSVRLFLVLVWRQVYSSIFTDSWV